MHERRGRAVISMGGRQSCVWSVHGTAHYGSTVSTRDVAVICTGVALGNAHTLMEYCTAVLLVHVTDSRGRSEFCVATCSTAMSMHGCSGGN